MDKDESINSCINLYKSNHHKFLQFLDGVKVFFETEPPFNIESNCVIHSIKSRLKDPEHLRDKLERKWNEENPILIDNFFSRITDLAGIRVLHLYHDQFPVIHSKIMEKVEQNDWWLAESPKAYTWDPESVKFYTDMGLECQQKESFYTSIHYLIKPREDSLITCEIQVRTLFEEIWGEIDHTINYPHPIGSIACNEQIRVLSKLVSTGTRLADSIFRTYNDHIKVYPGGHSD
ncbi:RelA/SpoT domain-containing protein [Paenibacillus senegalimassiliensis]|uniref:RelA/SpoT domain-containing protein n=1 Tax=Paenibacillus senegalimassiliensis TaxID=1737426 RepID=UPI00073E982B|nr:RelA/SpoT domain-containing protein [Paenibacillus senegalimassiliensis]